VLVEASANRIASLEADPSDPMSLGFLCEEAHASVVRLHAPSRIVAARSGGSAASTEDAIAAAGRILSDARRRGGQRIGLYLGRRVARDQLGYLRSLAFAIGVGTPEIYGEVLEGAEARLQATELVLGAPIPLLSDLARAQTVLLFGGDPDARDWGPLQRGMRYGADLRAARAGKKLRLFVADARAPEGDATHLAVLPGRETFLLLGLLQALVSGSLVETQFVRDQTTGFEALREALAAWPLDRCSVACGIDSAAIAGAALKIARSPTAVIHPGWSAFAGHAPLVGAWAWLAIHGVTAHLLRPGGLYDHKGAFDLGRVIGRVPSVSAPHDAAGRPLLLLQAPAADLRTALEAKALDVLVCVCGDPTTTIPGLDLGMVKVVALDTHETATTRVAQVVLPVADTWERFDQQIVDASLLPVHGVARAIPVVDPPPGVEPSEAVLRRLFTGTTVGVRGSAFGLHLAMSARFLAQVDFASWIGRLGELAPGLDSKALEAPPHRVFTGDADRATWRIPAGKIQLLPDAIRTAIAELEEPRRPDGFPMTLRTSVRDRTEPGSDARDPGAGIHPSVGVPEGARVIVETPAGSVETVARIDPRMRVDVVDLPWGYGVDVHRLYGRYWVDARTGTIVRDGHPCRVRQA
jgi:anaerobic selenocysteine-containing dehydrogenase